MGLYVADANGYMGDIASLGGWRNFSEWAPADGPIAHFIRDGYAEEPEKLKAALEALKAERPGVESIRRELAAYAGRADAVLILSDGESEDDEA
jgi:hypothetical protein